VKGEKTSSEEQSTLDLLHNTKGEACVSIVGYETLGKTVAQVEDEEERDEQDAMVK
jgi:hypothetical protein